MADAEANPETEVTIFTMGSNWFREKQDATSDFQNILDYLRSIYFPAGLLWFQSAINHAQCGFIGCSPDKQKRMLFLAGGLVDLCEMDAKDYGLILRDMGIAVGVVNFYLGEKPRNFMENQFGKMELDAFVAAATVKTTATLHMLNLDLLFPRPCPTFLLESLHEDRSAEKSDKGEAGQQEDNLCSLIVIMFFQLLKSF